MQQTHEQQVAASRWAEKYCLRIEQVLHTSWHELAERIREGIDQLSWYELTIGPGESFSKRVIEPEVRAWVERRIEPLLREATDEFLETVQAEPDWQRGWSGPQVHAGRELGLMDMLPGLLVPGGVAIGYGAVTAAVVTTTKLLIITTVVVNWPLLVGGLVIGTTLACFGVYRLSDLKTRLKQRFEKTLTGKLKEGLIGKGLHHDGKQMPSLLSQLQEQLEAVAAAARKQLEARRES